MAFSLRRAVTQTIGYSHYFGLPLTPKKLQLWLIFPRPVSAARLRPYFLKLTAKNKQLIKKRFLCSQKKLTLARRLARFLGLLPTIKLICATGSLAADNAKQDDDLDIMIVTSADTLWLTRPLVIFLLKAFNLRRPASLPEHQSPQVSDKVCDNLWLDETALALPQNKRNLYTAHEVLQARPLFDRGGIYAKFICANSWTSKYLANAYRFASEQVGGAGEDKKSRARTPRYSRGELSMIFAWPNRITTVLNSLAFKFQYSYMKKKITRETITPHSAYFHPHEYGLIELDG